MLRQIEDHLREMLESGSTAAELEIDRLRHELGEADKKLSNLIRLAEEGTLAGESVRIRMNELEEQKRRLAWEILKAEVPRKKPDVKDLGQKVAQFILDFERNFELAPIEERKLLVQKCISKIEVDKEKRVARFCVRRVPAVVPFLEEVNRSKNEDYVMSNPRARNPAYKPGGISDHTGVVLDRTKPLVWEYWKTKTLPRKPGSVFVFPCPEPNQ